MEQINIIIIDDHQMVIDGLTALIEPQPHIHVLATGNNGRELLHLLEDHNPDVILLDISMPDMDGREASREVLARNPDAKILILTMHHEPSKIRTLIEIGVKGYLLKGSGQEILIDAIETVAEGFFFEDKKVGEILQKLLRGDPAVSRTFKLTRRELDIMRLIGKDYRNKGIAETLFISVTTVESHRKNILSKAKSSLGINTMSALVKYLNDQGLLD